MDELKSSARSFEISKWEVWEAYRQVKANQGAPGVDGVTLEQFDADLKNQLYRIWNRMSSGSYFPPALRALVKVAGRWTYLYRAVDQHGQVIDVVVSTRRDAAAAREFFARALRVGSSPAEVTSDRATGLSAHRRGARARCSAHHRAVRQQRDRGRPRSAQGPATTDARTEQLSSARTVSTGHAFVQNLRRGHYAFTADLPVHDRVRVAFDELALCL